MISEHILSRFCKDPGEVPYDDTAPERIVQRVVPGDPLHALREAFPILPDLIRGKRVLDFGCGWGDQAGAMAHLGAEVTGLDTHAGFVAAAAEGSVLICRAPT